MAHVEQQLNERFFTNELHQLHENFGQWAKSHGVKLEKTGDSGNKQGLKLSRGRDGAWIEVAVEKPGQVDKLLPGAALDGVWGLVVRTSLNDAQAYLVADRGVWKLHRVKGAFLRGPGSAPPPLDDPNRWDQVDDVLAYLKKWAETVFGMQVGA